MRSFCNYIAPLGLALGIATGVQATLIDNGDGTITDTSTGLMWAQDANLAFGLTPSDFNAIIADVGSVAGHTLTLSDFIGAGLFTWWGAMAYAQDLTYAGYSDWRLPIIVDTGNPGCDGSFGGTDCGFNVDLATGELARLWTASLGNFSSFTPSGAYAGCGIPGPSCTMHELPFLIVSIPGLDYWSSTEYAPDPSGVWAFDTFEGIQTGPRAKDDDGLAWVVRTASTVPEPATLALLSIGIAGLGFSRLRKGSP